MKKTKIIVVLGPTSTGKSDLAVEIARKHKGEVISADSRQVYKKLDIGTGKITKKEMCGVPHHLLDVASPKTVFSVSQWQKLANNKIGEIARRDRLVVICGGTGFYIQSIVQNTILPEVPPNQKLRKRLESKSASELFKILKKLDRKRAGSIDQNNPARLVRAIEIAKAIGQSPEMKDVLRSGSQEKYDFLQIGLTLTPEELKNRIERRLLKRIKAGMIKEAENLHKKGLSWKRMFALGLEYRYLSLYLQKKLTKEMFVETLKREIFQYAKRQMTWFKRDKNIKWFSPNDTDQILKVVEKFLVD